MKKLIVFLLFLFYLNISFAQCKIIYQKSDGHFAYNENCAKKIQRENGYSDKTMKKIISQELDKARKLSKKQVKSYGRKITSEAKTERNNRWNQERKREQELARRRELAKARAEQNARKYHLTNNKSNTKKSKNKKSYRYQKPKSCGHSKSWHKKNGTCASPQ